MITEKLPSGNYRFAMWYTDELTGKRKRVSVTRAKNTQAVRREAEQALNDRIRRINSGAPTELTFGELCDLFVLARKPFWKAGTLRRYSYSLKALCGALGADSRADKLTARHVMAALSEKKAVTANELLRSFKTVIKWAYRNDYVTTVEWLNKLERFPEPTTKEKNKEKYMERQELTKLLPELKVDINRLMVQFLALSGLRIGEALALQKDDVDLSARVIRVSKTLDLETGIISEGAKTYSSNREVFMQQELFELVKDIRKYMTEMAMKCGFRTSFFFSDFEGRPLQYARLNNYFKENCRRVLGRSLSLHSLRHTHTSLMFEAGASLEAVSLRLGHADSRITKEIYLHITEKKREQYNAQIDNIRLLVP